MIVEPASQGLKTGKDIEAQDAGDAEYDNDHDIDPYRFPAAESEQVHSEGNDIFKHAYDR